MSSENLIPVVIVVITFILVLGLLQVFGWAKIKQKLLYLMLQAKRYGKDCVLNSGQAQEDWVVKRAMELMPIQLRAIIKMFAFFEGRTSEEFVRDTVRYLFHNLRDYMDDGLFNDSKK